MNFLDKIARLVREQGIEVDSVSNVAQKEDGICVWYLPTKYSSIHHTYILKNYNIFTIIDSL